MSIVFMDGFDRYSDGNDIIKTLSWFLPQGGNWQPTELSDIAIESSSNRFGGPALVCNGSQNDEALGLKFDTQTTLRIAFVFWFNKTGDRQFGVEFDTGSLAVLFNDNNGEIELRSLVESNTLTGWQPPIQTWTWVEIELVNGASGSITIYADGVQQYTGTHDLSEGNGFNRFYLQCPNGQTQKFDDIVVWNNDGSGLSLFPMGDSRIETLNVSGLGDTVEFTSQGDNSNDLTVDDAPGPDGDTTYNEGNPGDQDLFEIGNLSTSPSTINAVNIINVARKDINLGERKLDNTIKTGTTISSTSFSNLSSNYTYQNTILETNPDTGGAWSEAEINNLQIGYTGKQG